MLSCYAASRNKQVILEVLQKTVENLRLQKTSNEQLHVVDIASGTGEHATHFISNISNIMYQPTEIDEKMFESINEWNESIKSINNQSIMCLPIIHLNIIEYKTYISQLPLNFEHKSVNLLICINMIHISPIEATEALFAFANEILTSDGILYTYGPYRINDTLCESNETFDLSLKERNKIWGIRNYQKTTTQ